jgi:diguanylate cyclase
MPAYKPYPTFALAAADVLKFLHERYGFGLWMVTRTEGNDWIVLQAEDHEYGVKPGAVFRWADSFCSQMVIGRGPCIAPRSADVPAYAAAPIGSQVEIGAYIGIPLKDADGELFGTLCAIDPQPQSEDLINEKEVIELIGRLLSTCLVADLKNSADARNSLRLDVSRLVDSESKALSEKGWERYVAAEEIRCQKFGHPATLLSLQLPPNQGPTLREVVSAVSDLFTGDEVVARVAGEPMLLVLLPECNLEAGNLKLAKIRKALSGFPGVVVQAVSRDPRRGMDAALEELLGSVVRN